MSTAALLAITAAGCGGSKGDTAAGGAEAGGVTTLTWQMWSGSEVETTALNHLSEMVTKAHPDIKLTLQTSTFADYWTKLAAQASGGDVGCILGVQGPRAPSIKQLMLPLDDAKLKAAGVNVSDFNQSITRALQADGQQIAIPYDFGPLVVFYNTDAFKKADVPLPTIPEMISTFEYLQSLVKSGVLPQLPATNDTSAALNSFMAGDSAMVVDSPWQYGNIVKNAKFKPGVAVMPAGPQRDEVPYRRLRIRGVEVLPQP